MKQIKDALIFRFLSGGRYGLCILFLAIIILCVTSYYTISKEYQQDQPYSRPGNMNKVPDNESAGQKSASEHSADAPLPIAAEGDGQPIRVRHEAGNLLKNPSFEDGDQYWSVPDNAAAIIRDQAYSYKMSGTASLASLRILGSNLPSSPYTYSKFISSPGIHSASAWVFCPTEDVQVKLELVFNTGGGTISKDSGSVTLPACKWTRLAVNNFDSQNSSEGEVRLWLARRAPKFAPGSRVSSWNPGETALAASMDLALDAGDVLLAAVEAEPAASGEYQFFIVTTGGAGPADENLRLNNANEWPAYGAGSRVSCYRPAPGDSAPITDRRLVLNVGDLVFCKIQGREYEWHMVTVGAAGVSSTNLRLDDESSPPAFESGTILSRFAPSGTAPATGRSVNLRAGDITFCRLVDNERYDWALVTTGGPGPGGPVPRLNDEKSPPLYAEGSRFSYLTPSVTTPVKDTTIVLRAGAGLMAYTWTAPMTRAYQWHMVTTGGKGPADINLRLDDGPSFDKVWLDCVQVERRP